MYDAVGISKSSLKLKCFYESSKIVVAEQSEIDTMFIITIVLYLIM